MSHSREHTLASSLVERIKLELEEALSDEDYTRVVEMADSILGEDDEEAGELFNLVDDGSSDDFSDELTDDFDDLDEEFDDEEGDEDGYEEDFDEEDEDDEEDE